MQPLRGVEVSAPGRLHFGLLAFGQPTGRQFGGVGVMVETPRAIVRVTPDSDFVVQYGPLARRLADICERWSRRRLRRRYPRVKVEMLSELPRHVGLGSGTQTALAVAKALDACHELPAAQAPDLAQSVDRGQRSAVGTYGFLQGGLIVESGRLTGEALAPLACQVPLPDAWRFVMFRVGVEQGRNGMAEDRAFESIPPVTQETTDRLWTIVEQRLIPAAREQRIDEFGEALFDYGMEAGRCFERVQGGPFASPELAAYVQRLRDRGIRGVGQSSWGPTLFALAPNHDEAEELASWLRNGSAGGPLQCTISGPDNQGARTRILA